MEDPIRVTDTQSITFTFELFDNTCNAVIDEWLTTFPVDVPDDVLTCHAAGWMKMGVNDLEEVNKINEVIECQVEKDLFVYITPRFDEPRICDHKGAPLRQTDSMPKL
jgi:hypothetical protein